MGGLPPGQPPAHCHGTRSLGRDLQVQPMHSAFDAVLGAERGHDSKRRPLSFRPLTQPSLLGLHSLHTPCTQASAGFSTHHAEVFPRGGA